MTIATIEKGERKMRNRQFRGGKLGKNELIALKRLIGYILKNYKLAFIAVVIGIMVSAFATLCTTLFMKSLIDDYIMPLTEAAVPDYAPLAKALISLSCVLVVGIICSYGYNRIMVSVSQGTMKRLRIQLFTHMETLPISYFDTNAHGDIMSVYTNDVDTLRQLISQSLPQLINSCITLVSTFIGMITLDIPLTLVSLIMVTVMIFTTSKLSGLSAKYFVEQQRDLGKVNSYIEEMMEGQKVVKVFCHEEKSLAEFKELNESLRKSAESANKIANITMPVNANLGNISYVLCAGIGALLALGGNDILTIGTLVAFLNLNKSFTQPITQISHQINSVVMAAAGAERVFNMMDVKKEEDSGYIELKDKGNCERVWKNTKTDTETPIKGEIVFNNVDFGYTERRTILHEINLHARPGQKIALVGSTGAGKTTITNLINRFYDIQSGEILYDGEDIRKIKKPDLRQTLGTVLQDTHLFTGTVMENIRYGRLDATDDECISAAKLANAHSFIKRLPEGYNTVLSGSDSGLSQGQQQLLSIARAAVANPPVLILDEATSSIDTRTERLVQQGMDSLMHGRTSFVIAHRLSTVRNADLIIVLEHGRIIEQGNHDELIGKKGRYYQLYTGNAIGQ